MKKNTININKEVLTMKKLITIIRKYKKEYDNATTDIRKHWMCDGAAERICDYWEDHPDINSLELRKQIAADLNWPALAEFHF